MHVIAKDNLGNKVEIRDAQDGKEYFCLWCNVKMYGRHPQEIAHHFACYPKLSHTNPYCINRAHSNILRTLDDSDEFFRLLFDDDQPRHVGGGGPRPGPGPHPPVRELPPEDDIDDVDIINPDHVVTMPFRSLRQLWTYGLYSLDPNDPESHSDIVIFEGWYKHLFRNFNGGNRVIQAKPVRIYYKSQTIEFQCSWQGYKRQEGGKPTPFSLWRTFIVHFKDKKIFDEVKKQLGLHKEEQPNGSVRPAFYCTSALIAGNWISCTDKQYAYSAECTSKKQIYAIKK